jgi:HAD superfamily hydrolase (TIGR01484 family)
VKPFSQATSELKNRIGYVLTDIDDTLTLQGRLPSVALAAMEELQRAGIRVIPVTGRPAGWCDHIARMWPIDGLVGENGAFYFAYDRAEKKMIRRYWQSEKKRLANRLKLDALQKRILADVPGCRVSVDQPYREADLAIDFCEDVDPLPMEQVREIVRIFTDGGAQAKISSIHVNGWFGTYDKLAMSRLFLSEMFNQDLDQVKDRVLYCGDSPNDEPMFRYFPCSVGVANVRQFTREMDVLPAWVTKEEGGPGFAEMARVLLADNNKLCV